MTFFESFSKKIKCLFANQTLELKSYIKKMMHINEGREACSKNKIKEQSDIYIILFKNISYLYFYA